MSQSRYRSVAIVVLILAVGILGFLGLASLRPDAPREEREATVPAVTTVLAVERSDALRVVGDGSIQPAEQVSLVAEVPGRVVQVSRSFVTGGTVSEGEVLVRIDSSDYANAVAVAEAEVVQRRYDVVVATEEASIARSEWERVRARSANPSEAPETELGSLVLREPQQKLARAALSASQARLDDARNRLARTVVRAPFAGRVLGESVSRGQYLAPGTVIGTVYGSRAVEVTVPLQARQASLIQGLWSRSGPGIGATVSVTFGDATHTWTGRLDRVEGAVDAATRTIGAVVRVSNPMRPSTPGGPPLLPGLFARVEIEAPAAESYLSIPSEALRDGNVVWVVRGEQLRIQEVEVLNQVDEEVLVRSGLEPGDRVVTSNLLVVTDGMAVREAG